MNKMNVDSLALLTTVRNEKLVVLCSIQCKTDKRVHGKYHYLYITFILLFVMETMLLQSGATTLKTRSPAFHWPKFWSPIHET